MRPSVNQQLEFWRYLFNSGFKGKCIYTGTNLRNGNYELDHFVPWNFVFHNQLWNLIPVNPYVKSLKGNELPALDLYLTPFSEFQKEALNHLIECDLKLDLIEDDYALINAEVKDIVKKPLQGVMKIYSSAFTPLILDAKRIGFDEWKGC